MTTSSEIKTATSVHDVVYDELAERYAREPKQACFTRHWRRHMRRGSLETAA